MSITHVYDSFCQVGSGLSLLWLTIQNSPTDWLLLWLVSKNTKAQNITEYAINEGMRKFPCNVSNSRKWLCHQLPRPWQKLSNNLSRKVFSWAARWLMGKGTCNEPEYMGMDPTTPRAEIENQFLKAVLWLPQVNCVGCTYLCSLILKKTKQKNQPWGNS